MNVIESGASKLKLSSFHGAPYPKYNGTSLALVFMMLMKTIINSDKNVSMKR